MLHFLRRAVKSWVAKILLALLVASFAIWGIGDIFSFQGGTAVATVGDEEVTADEYVNALYRQQNRLSQQAGRAVSFSDMRALGVDRRVLAGLTRDAALRAELATLGIAAPDKAVAEEIRTNPAFIGPAGNFSDQAYRLLLAQQNITPAEFERLTRGLIGQELLSEAVAGTDATAPGLATRIAAWRGETRNVQLLTLPPRLAEDPGDPGDEALASFYDEHQEEFREPERRFGRYLLVDANALAAAERTRLTEEELRAAYEAEASLYRTPPTRKVEQITFPTMEDAEAAAARLASGETDFDALAAELGQTDTIDVGEIRQGDLAEGPDEAVFALSEPGVTGAVKTPLGAAILRVTEITEGSHTPFEEVRDEIAERLAREHAHARIPEIANQVDELRAAGKTFPEIAEEAGPGIVTGEVAGLAADGTLADGSRAPAALLEPDAAAEIAEALDAEERDMIELSDGSYFVAYIERIEPTAIPPLEDIRDRVVEAWRREQIRQSLEARAETIAAGIAKGTGATLASMAAGMGLSANETGFFTRFSTAETISADLAEKIFEAKRGEVVTGRQPDGLGIVLAEVVAIQPVPPTALEASSQQVETALAEAIRRDREEYFIRAVEAAQGARYHPQAIEEVFVRLTGGRG